MEIFRGLVQDQFIKFLQLGTSSVDLDLLTVLRARKTHWELLLRPDFGDVEWVKSELGWVGVFGLHDLEICSRGDLFTSLDGLPKVVFGPVRICTAVNCLWPLSAMKWYLIYTNVPSLFPFVVIVSIDLLYHANGGLPFEGMAAISMVVPPSGRCAVVAKEHQPGVITNIESAAFFQGREEILTLHAYWKEGQKVNYDQVGNSAGYRPGNRSRRP
jgi:hypothetical protein